MNKQHFCKADVIDRTAPEVYRTIFMNIGGVSKIEVGYYQTPPSFQERIDMTSYEKEILEKALKRREECNLPFWESILSICLENGECRDSIIDASLFHRGAGKTEEFDITEIKDGVLRNITEDTNENIGIKSRIKLKNGQTKHLKMLDFHCDFDENNTDIIYRASKRLIPEGFVILNSGHSYHAASINCYDSRERITFLGKALQIAPLVDTSYISHQLQQEGSSLRISKGGNENQYPKACEVFIP